MTKMRFASTSVALSALLVACGNLSTDADGETAQAIPVGAAASGAAKVSLCHVPPGNPENLGYMTVGAPAVAAHQAHGDGLCANGATNCCLAANGTSSICTSLQSDNSNCGQCGLVCPAGQVCSAGACGCPSGTTNCGGTCVNTSSDPGSCGACGNTCEPGQFCAGGSCVCPSGQALCGGVCVDVSRNDLNCGSCGNFCQGMTTCRAGLCLCPSGEQTACNGTCVIVAGDNFNCGACGNVCPSGHTCQSGVCAPTCVGGNIALNTNGSGLPNPLESDSGWGGGARPWDILQGRTSYLDTWAHGLAFTGGTGSWAGQSCGPRQATVDFGTPKTFNRLLAYHHGGEHIPHAYHVEYWNGSSWVNTGGTSSLRSDLADNPVGGWGSEPTENLFPAVTASKVRFVIDTNCDITHGWLYALQVFETCP